MFIKLGTVYTGRQLSLDFRSRHDKVRADLGMTNENSKLVRLTSWAESGTPQSRAMKTAVVFHLLALLFCTWPLISVFILISELYYFYILSDYRFEKNGRIVEKRNSIRRTMTKQEKLLRAESELKLRLNNRFSESFSIMIRTVEMSTESILQLILQLYIAIYDDFNPGLIQFFAFSTSFMSLVLGTFYWNSDFQWDRKYSDGLKAIPLYILSIIYKSLSITTMIGILSYYSSVPIFLLSTVLAVVYYRIISDDTASTKLFNVGSIYLRYISKIALSRKVRG